MGNAVKILAHCTQVQSSAEARIANDFDLKLAVEFNAVADDLKAAQTLIFRKKRTKEKIESLTAKIEKYTRQGPRGKSNFEIGMLKNQLEKLKDDLKRYETIGAQEL